MYININVKLSFFFQTHPDTNICFFFFVYFFTWIIVQTMSVNDRYHHRIFEDIMDHVEMPLIAPISTHFAHHQHNYFYPYNLTSLHRSINIGGSGSGGGVSIGDGDGGGGGFGGDNSMETQSRF